MLLGWLWSSAIGAEVALSGLGYASALTDYFEDRRLVAFAAAAFGLRPRRLSLARTDRLAE